MAENPGAQAAYTNARKIFAQETSGLKQVSLSTVAMQLQGMIGRIRDGKDQLFLPEATDVEGATNNLIELHTLFRQLESGFQTKDEEAGRDGYNYEKVKDLLALPNKEMPAEFFVAADTLMGDPKALQEKFATAVKQLKPQHLKLLSFSSFGDDSPTAESVATRFDKHIDDVAQFVTKNKHHYDLLRKHHEADIELYKKAVAGVTAVIEETESDSKLKLETIPGNAYNPATPYKNTIVNGKQGGETNLSQEVLDKVNAVKAAQEKVENEKKAAEAAKAAEEAEKRTPANMLADFIERHRPATIPAVEDIERGEGKERGKGKELQAAREAFAAEVFKQAVDMTPNIFVYPNLEQLKLSESAQAISAIYSEAFPSKELPQTKASLFSQFSPPRAPLLQKGDERKAQEDRDFDSMLTDINAILAERGLGKITRETTSVAEKTKPRSR